MTEHLMILTGASRGLGLAVARQWLQTSGHVLIALARHPDASLADRAQQQGSRCLSWALDLADAPAAAQALADWLAAQPADAFASATLLNNAGVLSPLGPIGASSAAELSNALRVGLEAPMLLTAAFLRGTEGWSARQAGAVKVLNVSSGLGRRAMAGSAAYCAAKAGMDHYSRAVALEEAQRPHPARIVSLAPGVVDTDMQVQLRAGDPAAFPDRLRFVQLKDAGLLDSAEAAAAKVLAWLDRADFGAQPIADVREG
ncbi:SDR family NAD(P)-dependent oxidoreductase [Sphaerotilus montanus]|uniref:NAD(P)-dependent dehydrogenase (Short-subunit alcohol dehydrogenase family) n=1 Tax=Sphaerotilus montanus TaxID=522889 RepID=A0A7Y9UCD5_9BURK|nr:SDR family NAD(P)-dependent oxidoreductase [Sphaerotilus montanus]NYG33449.1 NAD(P)-dependent dehydrogenase (short-subunit alcohol dehydrogenase family) [Sphaerotilus montanus]NZD58151.1 SDR family NAD(P)-dependent oxidoreductase [Sphaerotilus montanus]